MILDNENKELKVHEWISKYTEEGKFDLVLDTLQLGHWLGYLDKLTIRLVIFV